MEPGTVDVTEFTTQKVKDNGSNHPASTDCAASWPSRFVVADHPSPHFCDQPVVSTPSHRKQKMGATMRHKSTSVWKEIIITTWKIKLEGTQQTDFLKSTEETTTGSVFSTCVFQFSWILLETSFLQLVSSLHLLPDVPFFSLRESLLGVSVQNVKECLMIPSHEELSLKSSLLDSPVNKVSEHSSATLVNVNTLNSQRRKKNNCHTGCSNDGSKDELCS